MRLVIICLLGVVVTLTSFADEKLPFLRIGADVYTNVIVTSVTATDIYFTSDRGIGNAKLKNLSPDLQKRFQYDPATAAAAAPNSQSPSPAGAASAAGASTITRANAQAVMDDAIARVKAIVNQPVRKITRTPDMEVSTYSPGWFHPGAEKPHFKTVDIRTTQKFDYDKNQYVTSDINPGVAFIGPELEFNPMTKYFYTDRTVPKKKLSEIEMLEINRLYRIIGTCEETLASSPGREALLSSSPLSSPTASQALDLISQHRNGCVIGAFSLALLLAVIRSFRRNSTA